MSRRWGVWSRLAVVVTVLWLLIAPIAGTMHARSEWHSALSNSFMVCFDDRLTPLPQQQACSDEVAARRFDFSSVFYPSIIAATMAAAVAWAFGFAAVRTIRWILAGRNRAV